MWVNTRVPPYGTKLEYPLWNYTQVGPNIILKS